MAKTILAHITPEVLAWARNLDRISVADAAARVNVKVEKLEAWETGNGFPTLRHAKELAKFYRVPFVYFYLPDTPKKTKRIEPSDFRTFGNIGGQFEMSRELKWLLRDVEDRRDALLELYKMESRDPTPFEFYLPDSAGTEAMANQIRTFVGITIPLQLKFRKAENALAFWVDHLEQKDILVFQAARIDPREMRGLSIGYDVVPIVVLNRKDEYSARLFTLVHELAHIVLRNTGICNDVSIDGSSSKIEQFCNEVAGLVLVPNHELKAHPAISQIKKYGLDDNYVRSIARDFAVSREVVINRLCAVNIISKTAYLERLRQYTAEYNEYAAKKRGGQIPPPLDVGTQVGRLYTRTVLSALHNDQISVRDTSGYLQNLKPKHFESIERWCF